MLFSFALIAQASSSEGGVSSNIASSTAEVKDNASTATGKKAKTKKVKKVKTPKPKKEKKPKKSKKTATTATTSTTDTTAPETKEGESEALTPLPVGEAGSEAATGAATTTEGGKAVVGETLSVTAKPEPYHKHPYVTFSEGVTYSFVNRIQRNDHAANFVWQDHLIGLYTEGYTKNFTVNFLGRFSIFYPFAHTFNGMDNPPKQVILYAFDFFGAPYLPISIKDWVRIIIAPGVHWMYQLTDEYHLNYVGGGQQLTIELPIARRWTIMLTGLATLDYPNWGSNRHIQEYDFAYQFQGQIGFRYSRWNENKKYYIHTKKDKPGYTPPPKKQKKVKEKKTKTPKAKKVPKSPRAKLESKKEAKRA